MPDFLFETLSILRFLFYLPISMLSLLHEEEFWPNGSGLQFIW
uniref:Uncharacterized protein n=1 Tax=Anguilla anguilla TaxID=7936 RepID=A0A0E9XMY3_ANGAN